MRVAIVGCGQISRAHIGALEESEGIEIRAVCDRDKWRAQETANLVGSADAYSDLATLLERENPAAIHVLTPPETHAELAVQAMEAGCHVMVEKPMALSLQQADMMIASARENRVKLCTTHNYLFKPSIVKARRLVESGAIGQIVYVHSYYGLSGEGGSYSHSAGRYHWAWQLPGGVFTNFLPHLIYLQLLFLKNVKSAPGFTVAYANGDTGPATEMSVLLQGGAACGTMSISMRAKPYAKFVDIHGTNGMIHADLVREVCTVHRDRRLPRMISKALFSLEDSIQLASGTATSTVKVGLGRMKSMPGLRRLVREFYASIANGQEPPVPGEEGREMIRVMEMVWKKSPSETCRIVSTPSPGVLRAPQTDAERIVVQRGGMPGKVLVTGATGFLGHRLAASLSRCGADVVALVRDKKQVSPELKCQAKLVSGDVRDAASVEAAMRDVAVVYHCAAVTTNSVSWTAHYDTNVRGTEIVLQEALRGGVARVIHVSSVIVYGLDTPSDGAPVVDSTPCAESNDRWAHYMRSKIESEKVALVLWKEEGLPVTIVRPGILYGPGGKDRIGGGMIQLGALRFLVGTGRNTLPFTHVDNAVDCLLLAAVMPQAVGQAFNVVDEPQISVREVALKRNDIAGERVRLVPLPPVLLSAMARLLEFNRARSGSDVPPRLSSFVVHSACRNIQYDTTKARGVLGWQPTVTLEEGLRNMFQRGDVVV